ncbi:DUF3376 domain-containing protein [Vulcanococcus limneticus]|uniref:DUF3376 domain-containing protein n=1 Tax=Vulcanococcus limneticus TaxID=2170428 RepID=UPI00398BE0FA
MVEADDPCPPSQGSDPPATVPVTLNCSGGISLGAYMAGVFTELVQAALRPRAKGAEAPIRIDTITGASAGAMTGLIAARCLLQDPGRSLAELADDRASDRPGAAEPRNRFFQAWVRRADIGVLTSYAKEEALLRQARRTSPPPRPRRGLLSGASIAAITDDMTGDWLVDDLPGMRQALERRSLALLMTATNLQGVLRASPSGVRTVNAAETRRFLFHRAMEGLAAAPAQAGGLELLNLRWRKAKDSARASGAFPLAFPPVSNTSNPSSINLNLNADSLALYLAEAHAQDGTAAGHDPDRVCWLEAANGISDPADPGLRLRFDYSDGGVLDGLPILRGIGLLNQLTAPPAADADLQAFAADWFRQPPAEDQRRFVYVQPIPVTDLRSSPSLLRPFFGALASGLAGLLYPRAEHDHLRLEQIEEINKLVARRERLIEELALPPDDPQALHLRQVLPYRTVRLDPIDPLLPFRSTASGSNPFRTLLLEETAKVMAQPVAAAPTDDVAALVRFETLLGKRSPDQPLPQGALAPADLLASDFLGAFGGFFNERYRRHDYLIGRLSGLAWLGLPGPHGEPPLLSDDELRSAVQALVQRARGDYLPQPQRSGLRLRDWLRLLRLAVVRLPFVLLSDWLASRRCTQAARAAR